MWKRNTEYSWEALNKAIMTMNYCDLLNLYEHLKASGAPASYIKRVESRMRRLKVVAKGGVVK